MIGLVSRYCVVYLPPPNASLEEIVEKMKHLSDEYGSWIISKKNGVVLKINPTHGMIINGKIKSPKFIHFRNEVNQSSDTVSSVMYEIGGHLITLPRSSIFGKKTFFGILIDESQPNK